MIAFVHHRADADHVPASPNSTHDLVDRVRRALGWATTHGVEAVVLAVPAAAAEALLHETGLPRIIAVVDAPAPGDLGGALAAARGCFDSGVVVTIDARAPLGFDLRALIADHHQSPAVITIALVPQDLADPSAPCADIDRSGRILGLVPAFAADQEQPSVDGCIVVETGLLGRIAELDRPLDAWLGLVPFVLANGGLVGGYRVSPVSAGA